MKMFARPRLSENNLIKIDINPFTLRLLIKFIL